MKINLKSILYSLLGALPLMIFAFYNGYPIVYSDTSTYIASGFSLQPPVDRPLTYGLFIRIFSLNGLSLWPVVFMQSLILSWLILISIKNFSYSSNYNAYFLIIILLLSVFTPLPYVSGQLLPDVFTPVAVLCIINIIIGNFQTKTDEIILYIIFFFANAMHMSHVIINAMLLLSMLILKQIYPVQLRIINYRKILILFFFTLLGIIPMSTSIAKSKNVFIMGRMAENGILTDFLKNNCGERRYKLCEYADSIPENAIDFLWDDESPVYTLYGNFSNAQEEFGEIISASLLKPKYLLYHIYESVKGTFRQLLKFDIGDGNGSFGEGTKLFERIKLYFKGEANQFLKSRQNHSLMIPAELKTFNRVYHFIIAISLLLLILAVYSGIRRGLLSVKSRTLLAFIFLAIFLNAWVSSTLSTITDRFGVKQIWFILFITSIIIIPVYFKKDDPGKSGLN